MPTINQPNAQYTGPFKPGFDPRRSNPLVTKRSLSRAVEELCREHAELAIECLVGLIRDPNVEAETKRKTANDILDRGYGKAVDRVAIKQVGVDTNGDARLLTTEQIIALLTPAALECTPQEPCQQIISPDYDTAESSYIVVSDSDSHQVVTSQSPGDLAAQCDAPGAWPWSDTEEEAASRHQDDDQRSETTPLGDLK